MGNKMLIDAAHREETRVVVVDQNNQIEEFDYESASKRQLKGNIYLAKVTRVEPSLQAAFVDYGGNRHGFLAFSEIHPDYYQIPVADRQALLELAAEERRETERLEAQAASDDGDNADEVVPTAEQDPEVWASIQQKAGQPATGADQSVWTAAFDRAVKRGDLADDFVETPDDDDEDTAEERPRKRRYAKRYKIQEVIKRRQVMLVQIVKEERGNKGAAVTTYLSLAGRYGVLMPNTNRGGGISRKIANVPDRKRLRETVAELKVPDGMGLIIRTAGAQRTKAEIKRDYEYLLRLWENVRELTLKSTAPTLVYEEGSLIKRSIRDLYNKDIDSVLIEGDDGYKEAKAFMKMLIPSHAKNVKAYRNSTPLFQRYQVEAHLESMFNPVVQLKSGGYLVINPTEALISIDVNSGRATREHSIEETALKTNLEAAEEAARQFRLRDLAGLIVIDFIDMEEHRNNRAVERKMKESLKNDRARIQVGRISMFGLLEMSRQRMRAGLHESGTVTCPHCEGTGRVRSLEMTVLGCLRTVEEEGMRMRTAEAVLKVPTEVGLYLLNNKRGELQRIEDTYSLHVDVELMPLMGPNESEFVRGLSLSKNQSEAVETAIRYDDDFDEDGDDILELEADEEVAEEEETKARPDRKKKPAKSRARKSDKEDDDDADEETSSGSDDEDDDEDRKPRRRRRGRRGGRRNRRRTDGEEGDASSSEDGEDGSSNDVSAGDADAPEPSKEDAAADDTPAEDEKPARKPRKPRAKKKTEAAPAEEPAETVTEAKVIEISETKPEPVTEEPAEAGDTLVEDRPLAEAEVSAPEDEGDKKSKSSRRGWWQRRSGGES